MLKTIWGTQVIPSIRILLKKETKNNFNFKKEE
jgi:hypothetical protein